MWEAWVKVPNYAFQHTPGPPINLVGFPVGFTLSDVVTGTGPEDRPPRQPERCLDPVSDPSEGVLRPVPNRGNPVLSRFVETTRRLRFGLVKPDPSPLLQRTFGWIQPFAFLEGSFKSPFARDIDAHCDVAKLLSRRWIGPWTHRGVRERRTWSRKAGDALEGVDDARVGRDRTWERRGGSSRALRRRPRPLDEGRNRSDGGRTHGNVERCATSRLGTTKTRRGRRDTGAEDLACIAALSGIELKAEVFQAVVKLTDLGVVPTATAQVLKQFCKRAAVEGNGHGPQDRLT